MKYTFQQFKTDYPDDDACLDAIFAQKYGEHPTCNGCGVAESTFHRISGRRASACQWCGHHLYPCVGTPFEKSSTKLTLWFHAMYLMTATRNGVSAKELERQLGVTYKTAWRIGHELRKLMGVANGTEPLSGHVEVDETYIGGRESNKHASKKLNAGRGAVGKHVIFGMLERDGNVRAQLVPDTRKVTLEPIIAENVEQGSTISSDEHGSYAQLPALGYQHGVVDHRAKQYVAGIHHTNSIEGFWSHFKRGIRSTHVHISPQHAQKYVGEFGFRYNLRKDPAKMFDSLMETL
jgi:transposase-like protein